MKKIWQPTFVFSGFHGQTYGDGNPAEAMTHRYPSSVWFKISLRVERVVNPENISLASLKNRNKV